MASPVKVPVSNLQDRSDSAMIPAPTSAGIMGTAIANDLNVFKFVWFIVFCLAAACFHRLSSRVILWCLI